MSEAIQSAGAAIRALADTSKQTAVTYAAPMTEKAARVLGTMTGTLFGPLARAQVVALSPGVRHLAPLVVDHVLARKLSGAVWPAVLVLLAVLGLSAAAGPLLDQPEARLLAGLALLLSSAWGTWSLLAGLVGAAPWLGRWLRRPRGPGRFLEAELLRAIERWMADATEDVGGFSQGFLVGAKLTSAEVAQLMAPQLTGLVLRHLLMRLVLLVAPLGAALAWWRLVMLPLLVQQGFGHSPVTLALWPLAVAVDAVAGTGYAAELLQN